MLIYEPDVDDPLHTRNSVDNARSEEKRARVVEYWFWRLSAADDVSFNMLSNQIYTRRIPARL